ncbi:MAG: hypothetical protein AAF196_10390 [Planctomycetota bacterium]
MRLRSLLAALTLVAALPAQVTPMPGTGCTNGSPPLVAGSPQIGQSITVLSDQFPCNSPQTTAFVGVSVSCSTLPGVNFSCNASVNPCVLIAVDVFSSAPIRHSFTINIPNNPALVGAQFCVQGGCITTFLPPPPLLACFFTLNQAAQITILP